MSVAALRYETKGAVSVMFAAAAVPIIGFLGLAIDMSFITEAKSQLSLAADTSALSAVKLASNEYIAGTSTWQSDAETNGCQWFNAQLGDLRGVRNNVAQVCNGTTYPNSYGNATSTVGRVGTAFSSTVTYSATVPTFFTKMFGINTFAVSGQSGASITINAYVEIELLLDNSSSMLIGSSTADINEMQVITPCSPESATSAQSTSAYTGTYTPSTCPTTFTATSGVSYNPGLPTSGKAPVAAACGFACHWSTNTQTITTGTGKLATAKNDYTQYDYYYLARNASNASANPVGASQGYTSNPTLRFDVVQTAAANVVSTMTANQLFTGQFSLGVWEFNSQLTRVYPTSGEASTDLASGLTAIQAITTPQVSNNGDTDFPDELAALKTNLTNAGDGSTAATPKKALFIVTDGIQDYSTRSVGSTMGPFSNSAAVSACTNIKNMGISIYILYTPYTALPYNPFYVSNIAQFVNTPPTPNEIVTALENCASATTDFYEADIPSQISSGLTALLQAAISSPARISS